LSRHLLRGRGDEPVEEVSGTAGNEAITAAIEALLGGQDFDGVIELLRDAMELPTGHILRNVGLEAARCHLAMRNPDGPAGDALPYVREALGLIR